MNINKFLIIVFITGFSSICYSAGHKFIQEELFLGIHKNNIKKVIEAIEKGANVDGFDKQGRTPLNNAIYKGEIKIVKLLLKHNANVRLHDRSSYQFTPLHIAANVASTPNGLEIAQLLVNKGADVNAKNKKGQMPLHYAVGKTNDLGLQFVKYLISKGAKVNSKLLCYVNDVRIAKILIAHGAKVNYMHKDGLTPLHYIVDDIDGNNRKLKLIKFLIEKGANVNARTKRAGTFSLQKTYPKGSTPLGIARYYKHKRIMELLKKYGAKY